MRLATRFSALTTLLVLVAGWAPAASGQDLPIEIQVSPSTINLAMKGQEVTVHAELPFRGVVRATVNLNGIPVTTIFADNTGELVAKFQVGAVFKIVAPPSAVLTLQGTVVSDAGSFNFSGSDTVRVINVSGR